MVLMLMIVMDYMKFLYEVITFNADIFKNSNRKIGIEWRYDIQSRFDLNHKNILYWYYL